MRSEHYLPRESSMTTVNIEGMIVNLSGSATENHRVAVVGLLARCSRETPPDDPLSAKVPGLCWVYNGTKTQGYGYWSATGVKAKRVHRIMLECLGIHIDGLDVDHLCRNRACVNPAHLEPVTHRENARRGAAQKHLVAERCAHCGSSDGHVRNRIGGQSWDCRPCGLSRAADARARISASPARMVEKRARDRSRRVLGTTVRWREFITREEAAILGDFDDRKRWSFHTRSPVKQRSATLEKVVLRGERNGKAKINESIVIQIRSRAANGESCRRTASALGIGISVVKHVRQRRTWKHVP